MTIYVLPMGIAIIDCRLDLISGRTEFIAKAVSAQLNSLSVIDALQLAQKGYPARCFREEFIFRVEYREKPADVLHTRIDLSP